MKNPTLKGFEGTAEDFTKMLYEGWWTGSNDWEEGRGMITRLYQQSELLPPE